MESMVRINQLYVSSNPIFILDFESEKFKNATKKFHKLFNVPSDEKLVTCLYLILQKSRLSFLLSIDYSCSYWRGRVPRQGWLYLSVNYLCFYSYLLGKDITITLKFTDITVGVDLMENEKEHFFLFVRLIGTGTSTSICSRNHTC
jgi:hypothetical protein